MAPTIDRALLNQARATMSKPHPIRPAGAPAKGWGVAPQKPMGPRPHDDAVPTWFDGRRDWGGWWTHVAGWFAVFVAEGGNPAPVAEVLISDVQLWIKRGNGRWDQLQAGQAEWASTYSVTNGPVTGPKVIRDAAGAHCIPTEAYKIHGARFRVALPLVNGTPDVAGAFVQVQHRAQGPDAARSRYLVWAGVDWWPDGECQSADFAPTATYNPGACSGPMCLATTATGYAVAVTER